MRSLREDKLIAIEGKRVTILDFEALSLICDFENSYLGAAARALGSWSKPDELRQQKPSQQGGFPIRGARIPNTR
jgi:hypothetical protein